MDKFKQQSGSRAEIIKVLEEQRLEKIRRDFEKAKYEDERRFNHEKWLEDQKREILAAKLRRQNDGGSRRMSRANSQPDLHANGQYPQEAITAHQPPQTARYTNYDGGEGNTGKQPTFINAGMISNVNHRKMNKIPKAPMSTRNRGRDTVNFEPPHTANYSTIIPDTVV